MALLLEFRNLREIGEKSTGNVKPSEDRQGRQGLCQGRHCLPCLIAGYVPGKGCYKATLNAESEVQF